MSAATATKPRLVRRNYGRGHAYQLDGQKVVGVTTVLGTLDKPALRNWFAAQAAERAVNEWDRLSELPLTERLSYIKDGPRDVVRKAALRGTQIHDLGERVAHGEDVAVPDEHRGPVEAYARFLDRWDVQPIASETPVAHTQHRYAGTADLWARIGARASALCLLDVKTGKGVYSETGLQLAAYRFCDLVRIGDEERPTPEVDLVYVAHVLPDDVRMLPVEAGPEQWRTFLYLLQCHRSVEHWKDFPLIGEAEQS